MKKFYFVGGPKAGQSEAFFRRLEQIGGAPISWRIYPNANGDGKALHVIDAESEAEIREHLANFSGIYDRGEIVEIVDPSTR